jgi:hypothetical protein
MALEVMSSVRKLADRNRTVLSTIHQPSPEVFALFDKVLLLCAGRLVFFGDTSEAVNYFTRPELGYKFTIGTNAAEFIVDVCSGRISSDKIIVPQRSAKDFQKLFLALNESSGSISGSRNVKTSIDITNKKLESNPNRSGAVRIRRHATGNLMQFQMLMHRSFLSISRDIEGNKAKLIKNLAAAMLTNALFYNQCYVSGPLYIGEVQQPVVANVRYLILFLISSIITYACNIYRFQQSCFLL